MITEEIQNEAIYLASIDLLRRILQGGKVEKKILDRLNKKNAETMRCRIVEL